MKYTSLLFGFIFGIMSVIAINHFLPENMIFNKMPDRNSVTAKLYCDPSHFDNLNTSDELQYLGDEGLMNLVEDIRKKEKNVIARDQDLEIARKVSLLEREYRFERQKLVDLGYLKQ